MAQKGYRAFTVVFITILLLGFGVSARANDAPVASDDMTYTQQNIGTDIYVLMNDYDQDYDALTATITTAPSHGTATVNTDGYSINYTPATDYYGTDSFVYTISDGNGGTATATVTVNINGKPIAVDDTATVNQDLPVDINILSNDSDPENSTLSVYLMNYPYNGSAYVDQNKNIHYTPNTGWYGVETFSYTIDDGNGGYDTADVTVTVNQVQVAPTVYNNALSLYEDESVTSYITSHAYDQNGDIITIVSSTTPLHGAVVINDLYSFTYTPAANWNGTDSFTLTITDGFGNNTDAEIAVTIASVNDYPVCVADNGSTNYYQPITINVTANDTDVDNDTLTITIITEPLHGTAAIVDNKIYYTPQAQYIGPDTITYIISDNNGGSAYGEVSITVTNIQVPPVAVTDSITTNRNQTVSFNPCANDYDLNDDTITIISVLNPAHGTITTVNGVVTYVPNTGWFGNDTMQYSISDGNGNTAVGTINITVLEHKPTAVTDSAFTWINETILINVLNNDSDDLNRTPLTITDFTTCEHGTVSIVSNQIQFVPAENYTGITTFTYEIENSEGEVNTAVVTVDVHPTNHAPVAAADTFNVNNSGNAIIDLTFNDSDEDDDTFVIDSVTTSSIGTVEILNDDEIIFTADADEYGDTTFTYTIIDQHGLTSTAQVSVHINAIPVVTLTTPSNNDNVTRYSGGEFTVAASVSDPDGSITSMQMKLVRTDGYTISHNFDTFTGTYTHSFTNMPNGEYDLKIIAVDDDNACNIAQTYNHLSVVDHPSAPKGTFTFPTYNMWLIPSRPYKIMGTAYDPDGTILDITVKLVDEQNVQHNLNTLNYNPDSKEWYINQSSLPASGNCILRLTVIDADNIQTTVDCAVQLKEYLLSTGTAENTLLYSPIPPQSAVTAPGDGQEIGNAYYGMMNISNLPAGTYGDNQQINEIENLWDHTYDWGYISNDGDKAIIKKTNEFFKYYYDFNSKTESWSYGPMFDRNDNMELCYVSPFFNNPMLYSSIELYRYNLQDNSNIFNQYNLGGWPRVRIIAIHDGINIIYAKESIGENFNTQYDIFAHKINEITFENDVKIITVSSISGYALGGNSIEYNNTLGEWYGFYANRTGTAFLLSNLNANAGTLSLDMYKTDNYQWQNLNSPVAYYKTNLPTSYTSSYYVQGCVSGNNKMFAAQSYKMDTVEGFNTMTQGVVIADISTANNTDVSSYERKLTSYNLVVPVDFDYSGRYLLFTAEINGIMQVGIYDTTSDSPLIISSDSNGVYGKGDSFNPSISADGQTILYMTRATNLGPNMPRGGMMCYRLSRPLPPTIDNSPNVKGINLSTGDIELSSGSDISFESYMGNNLSFSRGFSSYLAKFNCSSPGLPVGWYHNYDYTIRPLMGNKSNIYRLHYPNGAEETIKRTDNSSYVSVNQYVKYTMEYNDHKFIMHLSDDDSIIFERLVDSEAEDNETTVYVPKRIQGKNKGIILNWDSNRKLQAICNDVTASLTPRTAPPGISSDISISYNLSDRIIVSGFGQAVTLYKSFITNGNNSVCVLNSVEKNSLRLFKYEYDTYEYDDVIHVLLEKIITPKPDRSSWDTTDSDDWMMSFIDYSKDKKHVLKVNAYIKNINRNEVNSSETDNLYLDSKISVKYGTQTSDVTYKSKELTSDVKYIFNFDGVEKGRKFKGPNNSDLSTEKRFSQKGDLTLIRRDGYLLSDSFSYAQSPFISNIRNIGTTTTIEGNIETNNISYSSEYKFGRIESRKINDLPDERYKYYDSGNSKGLLRYKLTPKSGVVRDYQSSNELLDNNFYVTRNTDGFVVQRVVGGVVDSYIVTEYEYNSDNNISKIYALKPDGVMGYTEFKYENESYRDKVTDIIYPDGKKTHYEYDNKGRIIDEAQSKYQEIADEEYAHTIQTNAVNHTTYYYDYYDRIEYILMPPTNITGTFPLNLGYTAENGRVKIKYVYNGTTSQVLSENIYNETDHDDTKWIKQTNYKYSKDGSVCETESKENNGDNKINVMNVKTSDIIPVGNAGDYSIITLMHSTSMIYTTVNSEYLKAECVVYDKNGNVKSIYTSNNPLNYFLIEYEIEDFAFPIRYQNEIDIIEDYFGISIDENSDINMYTCDLNFKKQKDILYTNQCYPREVIDKNNRHTYYTYDSRYRMTSIRKFADGATVPQLESEYYYNGNNTLNYKKDKMTDGSWIYQNYNYDWSGNVLNRSTLFTDPNINIISPVSIGYRYDTAGNRNKIILPNGEEIVSSFDGSGNLSKISSPYGNIEYKYNYDSRLLGYLRGTSGNSWKLKTIFNYDQVGKLTGIANIGLPATNNLDDMTGVYKSVFNSFNYDSHGRLKSYMAQVDKGILDIKNNNDLNIWQDVRHIAFNYNDRGQLIDETHKKNSETGDIWSKMVYNYDDVTGVNLTGIDRQMPGEIQITNATPKTFNLDNRITNNTDYIFDSDTGNPTTYAGRIMTYDLNDRLVMVKSGDENSSIIFECGYYADGKRAWKKSSADNSTKVYFIYDGDQLLCELKQPVYPTAIFPFYDYIPAYVTAVNLWGADGLAGRAEWEGNYTQLSPTAGNLTVSHYTTTWFAYDQQGNIAQRYNSNGGLTGVFVCDAFGNKLISANIIGYDENNKPIIDDKIKTYGYNAKSGYYYDIETGFYYCMHRYYDPANGRWLTEDPIGYEGGLNLYGYCGNQPVGRVDASGLWAGVDDLAAMGIGLVVGLAGQGISDLISGELSDWEDYVASGCGGIVGGEVFLCTVAAGPAGWFLAGTAGGATSNTIRQGLRNLTGKQSGFDSFSWGIETGTAGIFGIACKFVYGIAQKIIEKYLSKVVVQAIPDNEIVVVGSKNTPGCFKLRPQDYKPLDDVVEPGKSASIATDLTLETEYQQMFQFNPGRGDYLSGAFVGDIRAAGFDVVRAPTFRNPLHVRIIGKSSVFDDDGRAMLSLAFDLLRKGR